MTSCRNPEIYKSHKLLFTPIKAHHMHTLIKREQHATLKKEISRNTHAQQSSLRVCDIHTCQVQTHNDACTRKSVVGSDTRTHTKSKAAKSESTCSVCEFNDRCVQGVEVQAKPTLAPDSRFEQENACEMSKCEGA